MEGILERKNEKMKVRRVKKSQIEENKKKRKEKQKGKKG
jgi:hypothetical protein